MIRQRLATCVLIAGLPVRRRRCSGPPSRGQETGQDTGAITGRVVDARTGAGLGKVLVLVEDGGPSTRTDDSGAFALPRVDAGPRRLYVSVVGYILVRRDVQVERRRVARP